MSNVDRAINRVFVANFQEKSFEPAERFGEVIFITTGFVRLNDMEAVRAKIAKYVELSRPTDFVIFLGPSVINTMLAVLWFHKHGYINVLSWDNKRKDYNHFVVGVNEIQTLDGAS